MKGTDRFATVVFLGLSALSIVVLVVSFIGAVSWVNKPFAGLLIYDFPQAGSMSLSDWAGRKSGIKLLDRIVSVDGVPVQKGQDLVKTVRNKTPGSTVSLEVISKGAHRNYTLPVTLFGLREFILVFLLTYIGGLALFCLGVIVYVLKPNITKSWVFFLFCFFLSLYMVSSFEIQSTYYLVHLHYSALCLMPAVLFHLGLVFPERKSIVMRLPWIEYLVYLPALLIAIGYQIYLFNFDKVLNSQTLWWIPDYTRMMAYNRVFTLACVLGMIALVFHSCLNPDLILVVCAAKLYYSV